MAFKMKGSPMKRNFGIGASPMEKSALKTGGFGAFMDWATGKTTDDTEKKDTKPKPGSYVKPGGKATGSMKDYAIGSEARKKEYDARGWKYDETIAGYNKDGTKKEEAPKSKATVVRESEGKHKTVRKKKTEDGKVIKIKDKTYASGEKKKQVSVVKDKEKGTYSKSKIKYNKDGTIKKVSTRQISSRRAARIARREARKNK